MKKTVLFLIVVSIWSCTLAQSLSNEQEKLRGDIYNFLRQERYNPSKTDRGISFRFEGVTYQVEVDSLAEKPMCVRVVRKVAVSSLSASRDKINKNIVELNNKFVAKVSLLDDNVLVYAELFLTRADDFTGVIESVIAQMTSAYKSLTAL